MNILGIDECRKGCLIGSLFIAGTIVPEEFNEEFKKLGVKDSKKLSPKKRAVLKAVINERCKTIILSITPEEIDNKNIVTLEAEYTAKIIKEFKGQFDKIIIDCPSTSTIGYQSTIKKLTGIWAKAEHKADDNYIAVSCASIMAKEAGEEALREIQEKYKHLGDFGSGYTSDKKTIEFLRKNIRSECDWIFRKSWSTYSNMLKEKPVIENEQMRLF